MASGIFHFEIGRAAHDRIVAATGVHRCTNRSNSDVVVTAVGMNLSPKTNGYNVVVSIVGGIVSCEEVFNTSPKWFSHKPNSSFRD
ncbi:Uncharacterised protein [Vibrio cholerae]|nr:Uncharacterised protein [Vibrio cholerae]CSC23353.1 Uncharacterised protein [Vibrio cholerae]